MLSDLVREVVQAIGIEGVSAGVLALLVAVALYAHKAASTGQRVVHAGSTVQHDLKVVAVVLALLLVAGVLEGVDVARTRELLGLAGRRLADLPVERWLERVV